MVSAPDSGSNGFVPWTRHCVVFLGKILNYDIEITPWKMLAYDFYSRVE